MIRRWFLVTLVALGLHASARATAPADSAAVFDLQSVPAGRELLQRYLDSPTWESAGSGALLGYAVPAWRSESERAVLAARQSLPRIAAALGVRPQKVLPVWILVSPGSGGFAREAPTWSAAIAQPQRHLIVLSGPAMRQTRMNLEETVAHELAHLALAVRLGEIGWVPRWFDEGLAMHLSGYQRFGDRLAHLGRGPVHLGELTDAFPENATRAQLAYLESEAAVRRLLTLGPLPMLLDRLARGEEFEAAFAAVYGMSTSRFADDVYDEVAQRWRWLTALGGGVSLFGVMTLLFLIGGVRRLRRNAQRRRAWEAAENALESTPPPDAGDAPPTQ